MQKFLFINDLDAGRFLSFFALRNCSFGFLLNIIDWFDFFENHPLCCDLMSEIFLLSLYFLLLLFCVEQKKKVQLTEIYCCFMSLCNWWNSIFRSFLLFFGLNFDSDFFVNEIPVVQKKSPFFSSLFFSFIVKR